MKYLKTCEQCQKQFTVIRFWARFCGPKCRAKAFYHKKAEQALESKPEALQGPPTASAEAR